MQGRRRVSPHARVRHREGLPIDAAVVSGLDGWEDWEFIVRVDRATGTPKIIELRITAPPGQYLNGSRVLPYGELARLAAWSPVGLSPVGTPRDQAHQETDAWLAQHASLRSDSDRPRGGSREFSEEVAEIYLAAQADGISTWRAVALAFGYLTATTPASAEKAAMRRADRRIEEAREFGVLPPSKSNKPETKPTEGTAK